MLILLFFSYLWLHCAKFANVSDDWWYGFKAKKYIKKEWTSYQLKILSNLNENQKILIIYLLKIKDP